MLPASREPMSTAPDNEVRSSAAGAGATQPRHCVTIISNNLSAGGSLACATLARALGKRFQVQILGSTYGPELWPGMVNLDTDLEVFPSGQLPGYFRTMQRMAARIRGDVVIAHQIRLPSFGIGLLNKLRHRTPCTLYIDDDDLALTMPGRRNRLRARLRTSNGDLSTRLLYRFRGRADAVFCGSEYFAKKFGGLTVPLGRDPERYDPARGDREEIRRRLGVQPQQTVIGFMGNPRPHVGIEDLVRAIEIVDDPDLILLVVPPGTANDDARRLFERSSANVELLEDQASEQIPAYLAASDLVVVPQRTEPHSMGQLPARLVEAMAMARPVIATKLADTPELLGDSAIYVRERAPQEIADAIRRIRQHPEKAQAMAQRAREVFLRRLSLDAMADRLVPALEALMDRSRKRKQ